MHECSYILPIRRSKFSRLEALNFVDYFTQLGADGCEVLVIDGSPRDVFSEHKKWWSAVARHEPVNPRFKFLNDKVNGIHTGVALATTDKIILADDDIRFTAADLARICALLDEFEVVRPQNYLVGTPRCGVRTSRRDVSPVWAYTEAARMLINRATLKAADYPGTCGFRRQTFLNAGEYDGDVLFDNEELVRHFARAGARISYQNDFFVSKRPPSFRKWLEQRPRQAYEDFGLRFKTIFFAALLPVALAIALIDPKWLSIFLLSVLVAFAGWLRGNAQKYFSFRACLFAPIWILERTISTYLAFYWMLARGGYPFGKRLLTRGIGRDWIEGGRIGATMVDRSNR